MYLLDGKTVEKLIIIKTLSELSELYSKLDGEFVSFDTETTGVDKDSLIIGVSVSDKVNLGYYVILRSWNAQTQKLEDLETLEGIKQFISFLLDRKLIMHNAGFDCAMVNNSYGIDLMPAVHTDTMLLAHLLDENRSCGLKDLGVSIYGEDAKAEQIAMKDSVTKNGGQMTKANYELYKGDADLIAQYGAKDAILTLNLFYHLVLDLYDQGLDKFFYDEETMPQLKGPTYDLNNVGLKVDTGRLQKLKQELETECLEAKSYIYKEITSYVLDKYPGTNKTNGFNIGAPKQMAWLVFVKLENPFNLLTKEGKLLCKALNLKLPYALKDKAEFIRTVRDNKNRVWAPSSYNPKTKKMSRPKKIGDYWTYMACGKETLGRLSKKYKWVEKYLEYAKNLKLLNTYVTGIQERMTYGIIRPQFLQHGTTSGRYSSKRPNFQNLPRDDKRLKSCIIAREGNVFVGADYSQLEPRVFASFSGDERLLKCFSDGDDFYSVIGMEVFEKYDCSLKKDDKDSFAKKYPELRQMSKTIALAATYGTTAPKMAPALDKTMAEAQVIINSYFEKFPSVRRLMLESHKMVKADGKVVNLFGRPRRMPEALNFPNYIKKLSHEEAPYEIRNTLNLAVNHRIQSTGASIMNRAAIAFCSARDELTKIDSSWSSVKMIMQVHDEIILEGPVTLKDEMIQVLKHVMENTVVLPGVDLIAEPKAAFNLADLK